MFGGFETLEELKLNTLNLDEISKFQLYCFMISLTKNLESAIKTGKSEFSVDSFNSEVFPESITEILKNCFSLDSYINHSTKKLWVEVPKISEETLNSSFNI